jgi:iron complex outermembrane receptor protein
MGKVGRTDLKRTAVVAGLALAVALQAAPAYAQEVTYTLDLPAQDLASSLKAFARAARQQLTFDADVVRGKRAPALRGSFTIRAALARLLDGSGLQGNAGRSGVIIIQPMHVGAADPATTVAAAAAPEPAGGEEIVVTAEKRAQSIQTVPASVSALGGQRLVDLGLTQLTDYTQYVAGLNVQSGGSPGQASITLRGIAPVGPGSVVGYYIDDTPLGSSTNYAVATLLALDLMPYDLDRFEVLRGPQGTLYGAGAMGGLIKYVLKQADTTRFGGQVGAEINSVAGGSRPGGSVRAAINIPLVRDHLAIRASLYDREYAGYTDNVMLGDKDSNKGRQYGGRVALTWKPSPALRVNLSGLWNRTTSDDNAVVTLGNVTTTNERGADFYQGQPVYGRLAGDHPFAQPFSKAIDYYSASINYDAPLGITVSSATSWSRTVTHRLQDATVNYGEFASPAGYSDYHLDLGLRKFTQELRATSASGGFVEWLVGGFYTHESSTNQQLALGVDTQYRPLGGLFDPFLLYASLPSTYREAAAFGDVTLNLTPKLAVTGGLRYAHNSQKFRQILDGAALGGFADIPGHSSDDVTTWSVSARYRFTSSVMAYARVATGYRPGGPNAAIAGAVPTVASDKLTSYEAGLKSSFLNGRLLFNISAFTIDWKGIQQGVSNAACGCSYLANVGNAYSRGFEVEGYVLPIEGLRLGYNAAYTKARLTRLAAGAPPLVLGFQLPGVPAWSAGATADYNWPIGDRVTANVGGGVHYVGRENFSTVLAGSPNSRDPGYTTGDLRAGLGIDRYRLNLFVRNVTNKLVYLSQTPMQSAATGVVPVIDARPLEPRTIGLSLDVKL